VLTIHTLPVPKTGANEVLIEMHAAGVGIWDAHIRQGTYVEGRVRFPLVLGTDGAGVIAEVGKNVRRFRRGDEVWAYQFSNPKGGFYAEYVAVKADGVGRAPQELSLIEAGAAAVTGLTAQQGIDDHLKVVRRDTVLVFGATGAVGSLAVQFARRTGAHVVATASTTRGRRALREIGIEDVFNPRARDAADRLRALAPEGLTALLALAGGRTLERCIDQVVPGGRIAYPNGVEPEPRKRPKIRKISYDAEVGPDEFRRLNRAVAQARLKVVIERVYRLRDAAKAHARVEKGHVVGRLVLRIR
jgi:NADPH:quinone reductase-like Zn-dependent oxidoreductase